MSHATVSSRRMMIKVMVAAVIGNAMEWFDFAIYGMFAVVISRLYFPTHSSLASILLALATFGVGFAVRPIGGVLLGFYADRVGRRKALSVTVLLMAVGTGLTGILPPYAAIGLAAPLLMVCARLIQGFSTGGEFTGATTMMMEFAPRHLRGFYASFQMCSQALAFACGALSAFLLTTYLSRSDLDAWGWRIPFLFGMLIGPVAWYIRSRLDESPEFVALDAERPAAQREGLWASIARLFRDYPREVTATLCINVIGTVSAYIFIFFVPIFSVRQLHIPLADANLAAFVGTAILIVCCPITGYLTDRVGRRPVLMFGAISYGIASFFMFRYFVTLRTFDALLLTEIVVPFFMSFLWGPAPIVQTEIFPVGVRATGAAIVYNVAVLVFGGMAPFYNTWLVAATHSDFAPAYYVLLSVAIGIVGVWLLPSAPRFATTDADAAPA